MGQSSSSGGGGGGAVNGENASLSPRIFNNISSRFSMGAATGDNNVNNNNNNNTRQSTALAPVGGNTSTENATPLALATTTPSTPLNLPTSSPPAGGSSTNVWCYIKAETRLHNSAKVIRRSQWYEAKGGSEITIGRAETCDLQLEDNRCASINAKIVPNFNKNNNDPSQASVILTPESRIYSLVGMGLKRSPGRNIIRLGSVMKVGSVSLEVTSLCTDTSDDFFERFSAEIDVSQIKAERRNLKKQKSIRDAAKLIKQQQQQEENVNDDKDTENASSGTTTEINDHSHEEDDDDEENEILDAATSEILNQDVVDENEVEDGVSIASVSTVEPEMCYICWEVEGKGSDSDENDEDAVDDADQSKLNKKNRPNPMIRNPCGKCSGSSRYVHLHCILKWIESSGSGHCSICNSALPSHFSSPPPNIELKVVRHRRGQAWIGTRRFRLSFAEHSHATIGRDTDADVMLGDRSVCGMHSRITYRRDTKEFELNDCSSLSGTFLQVTEPLELNASVKTYLKIGRTMLSMKVAQSKRNSIMQLLPSWNKR